MLNMVHMVKTRSLTVSPALGLVPGCDRHQDGRTDRQTEVEI